MPSGWGCPEGARHPGACAARIHPRPDFGLGRRPPGWRPHSSTDGWVRPMTQGGATFAARMLLCPGLGWGRPLGALHSGQGRHDSVRAAIVMDRNCGPGNRPTAIRACDSCRRLDKQFVQPRRDEPQAVCDDPRFGGVRCQGRSTPRVRQRRAVEWLACRSRPSVLLVLLTSCGESPVAAPDRRTAPRRRAARRKNP